MISNQDWRCRHVSVKTRSTFSFASSACLGSLVYSMGKCKSTTNHRAANIGRMTLVSPLLACNMSNCGYTGLSRAVATDIANPLRPRRGQRYFGLTIHSMGNQKAYRLANVQAEAQLRYIEWNRVDCITEGALVSVAPSRRLLSL